MLGGISNALGVVAGRSCDNAVGPLFVGELGNAVVGTANLKTAGFL